MKARAILEGAAYGPEVLKVLGTAFDEAWAEVEGRFLPHQQAMAREILARALTSMARMDSDDVAMLKNASVRVLRDAYAQRFKSGGSGQSGTDG